MPTIKEEEDARKEYQRKHIKIKSFLTETCCQMCGRVVKRSAVFGISFWIRNDCLLPTRPEQIFLDNLCRACYDWIRTSQGYIDQCDMAQEFDDNESHHKATGQP